MGIMSSNFSTRKRESKRYGLIVRIFFCWSGKKSRLKKIFMINISDLEFEFCLAPWNIKQVNLSVNQQFWIDKLNPSYWYQKDRITNILELINKLVVMTGDNIVFIQVHSKAKSFWNINYLRILVA